ADMISEPRFDPADLEREQRVILEEMKMVEDTPDELLGELFNSAYFPDHPLGRPIEGTEETVSSFDHNKTAEYHAREFSSDNLVIAAAGNIDHKLLVDLTKAAFVNGQFNSNGQSQISAQAFPTAAAPILIEEKRELEQAHLIIATPWPSALSSDRYAAGMLASVIGGGPPRRPLERIRGGGGAGSSPPARGRPFSRNRGFFFLPCYISR